MKHNNSGRSLGSPAVHTDSRFVTNERQSTGLLSRSKALLGFALLLALQLVTGKASAAPLTTTGFSCSLPTTPTSSCVVGSYATFGLSATNSWTYTVSTSGYSSIQMSFKTSSSATGPTTGLVYYNIGGGDVLVTSYTVNTSCATKTIALPTACNNVPSLTIKCKMSGGTNTGGTNRINSDGGFTGTATSFCSGTPNPGTVVVGTSPICGSGSSALTLTPGSTGSDLKYQWYSSTGLISGATNLVYTTPAITSTSTYSVVTTCPTSGFSSTPSTGTVTINALPAVGAITTTSGSISPVLLVGSTATLSNSTAGGVWMSSKPSLGTIDPITGVAGGKFGGTTQISYLVSDPLTGCSNSAVANVNIVWNNTLALYAGHDGNSVDVIPVGGETVSNLSGTGFGSTTPCGSGGISGLTVSPSIVAYSSANPHVSYTITPNTGNALNIFEFHVSSRSSGTGPATAILAYNDGSGWVSEGAAHTLSTSGSCGANTNQWYWVPSAALMGITTPVEIAIFPYNSASVTGTFQVNSLEVIGNITSSTPCAGTPIAGVITPSVTTVCNSGYFFGTFAGAAAPGISYQWQSDEFGSFADIVGANNVYYTSPTYSVTTTSTINYQVVTTCASFTPTLSNVATLNVVPTPGPITVTSGSIAPYLLTGASNAATLSNATAGGVWSSGFVSSAVIGSASGIVTGIMPGIVPIRYSLDGFGPCTVSTTVSVIYPGSYAVYLGTGGTSTATTNVAPTGSAITTTSVVATGFGTATACGRGGISGLTVAPALTSYSTSGPNVSFTTTGATSYGGFAVTLRRSSQGATKARLAYSVNGGTWVDDAVDHDVDEDDCGFSPAAITYDPSTNPLPTGLLSTDVITWAVFPHTSGSLTGSFQVNTVDVTNADCAAPSPIQVADFSGTHDLDGSKYNYTCADFVPLPLSVASGSGGTWSSDNAIIGAVDPMTGDLLFTDPAGSDVDVVITYENVCGVATHATVTVSSASFTGCNGSSKQVRPATPAISSAAVTGVNIYPNPANNVLNIAAAEAVNVTVMSMDGRSLIDQKNATKVNVSNLAGGVYMIKIYNGNNSLIKTAKFTKQ